MIGQAGAQHIQLTVSEQAWRPGLDPDKAGRGRPFRTAVFSLLAEVSCTNPIEINPATRSSAKARTQGRLSVGLPVGSSGFIRH
jgi:hypothetical protein